MAFNGSGTYNLPAGNPVVTNTVISSVWSNGTMNDIASALSICFTRDGQAPAAANISMGNHKLTQLAQATLDGDALAWGGNASIADLTVTGTMSGAGVSSYLVNSLASPPAIGNTTPSTVKGTTVTATTQFTGLATGLTGTASGLSIGGNAATATTATTAATATNISGGTTGQIPYQTGAGTTGFKTPTGSGNPVQDTSPTITTPTIATIKSAATLTPPVFQDSAGVQIGTLCRAWVNFNGSTSPGTIRASFNVSSVTKNGTGDYTVNFTNAMPDANYSTQISVSDPGTNNQVLGTMLNSGTYSINSVQIQALYGLSRFDLTRICVSIFR